MEGKNISIPRRVLRPCHLSTDWLPFAPLQQEPSPASIVRRHPLFLLSKIARFFDGLETPVVVK
jgi:hypothetical protein